MCISELCRWTVSQWVYCVLTVRSDRRLFCTSSDIKGNCSFGNQLRGLSYRRKIISLSLMLLICRALTWFISVHSAKVAQGLQLIYSVSSDNTNMLCSFPFPPPRYALIKTSKNKLQICCLPGPAEQSGVEQEWELHLICVFIKSSHASLKNSLKVWESLKENNVFRCLNIYCKYVLGLQFAEK